MVSKKKEMILVTYYRVELTYDQTIRAEKKKSLNGIRLAAIKLWSLSDLCFICCKLLQTKDERGTDLAAHAYRPCGRENMGKRI